MTPVKPSIPCAVLAASIALILTALAPPPARADTWTAATGDWFEDVNWLDGTAPAAGDDVVVDNGGTARVQMPGAAANHLAVGLTGGSPGFLEILNGGTLSSQSGILSDEIGSRGIVTVTGDGSAWTHHGDLVAGNLGVGIVTLTDGGRADVAGTLTLSNSIYHGAGVLNIGAPGSGAGVLNTTTVHGVGTADIYFHHTDGRYYFTTDGTADGRAIAITGATAVHHTGAGTTVLTGSSDYTGPTTIDAGTLRVNGAIASATTAHAGGTLGGSGSVGDVVVTGGTLAPGNSPGTLTIDGSLTLGPARCSSSSSAGSRPSTTSSPSTATWSSTASWMSPISAGCRLAATR